MDRNCPDLAGAIGPSITFGHNGRQVTARTIQNDESLIRWSRVRARPPHVGDARRILHGPPHTQFANRRTRCVNTEASGFEVGVSQFAVSYAISLPHQTL
jgi:hypothetical protein